MTTIAKYTVPDREEHPLSTPQREWPTLGWLIGELRWYAVGGIAGGVIFAVWMAVSLLVQA